MKSLLVSNLNNLGDVICSTAALALIKDHFPGIRLTVVVRPEAAEAVRGHPIVDRITVFHRKVPWAYEAWRLSRKIHPEQPEAFLSLDRKPGPALLALLLGIKQRIVPDRLHLGDGRPWWLRFLFSEVLDYPSDCFHSLVEMFSAPTRRALGIPGEERGKTSLPPLPESSRNLARETLAQAKGRPLAGFSLRANFPLKNWLPERWAEVMDALEAERNFFIYAAGTAEDRAYIEKVAALRRRGGLLNLAGQTSVLDLAALAGESDLFITLDTGAAHVAGNGGVGKLVVIFTCTEPEGISDSAPQARAVSSREPCCPCRKRPEDCPEPACQRKVTVEMVLAAARDALAGGRMAG